MKSLAILAAAVLAGCASAPQPTLEEQAAAAPTVNLCAAILYMGRPQSDVAAQEIARRGVNCQDHAQAVLQLQAARDQARNQAAGIMLQQQASTPLIAPLTYQPVPVQQLPSPVTCTSQRFGVQVQTVCR
jgi:hypothetical protein